MLLTFLTWFSWAFGLLIFVWILPKCFPEKHWFRFYAAMIMLAYTSLFFCIPTILVFSLKPRNRDNFLWWQPMLAAIWKWFGVDFELRNLEILQRKIPGLILMNHQSTLDIGIFMYLWDRLGYCVAAGKKETKFMGPFGIMSYLSGAIFIDRSKGRSAGEAFTVAVKEILTQNPNGRTLTFPEGTRNSHNEKLLPFKKGSFITAIQLQIPIIPLVNSEFHFFHYEERIFSSGKVIISCLEPIPTKDLTMDDVDILMEKTAAVMQEEYTKITNEVKEKLSKNKTG